MATDSVPPKTLSPLLARIADYISLRLNEQEIAIRHYVTCQESLRQQLSDDKVTQETYNKEMDMLDDSSADTMLEFQIIDKQFRLVAQDMEDEVYGMKAIGTPSAGDDELVEKAYYAVVREAKRSELLWRQRFSQTFCEKKANGRTALEDRVLSYYDAVRTMHDQRQAHCSLTGWYPDEEVGVARLVPASISSEQISFLFGANQVNLVNGKNCIPLQKNLAQALDCGIITFIPLPPTDADQGPTWTCILVDDGFRDQAFAVTPDGKKLTYRDIHGNPLIFHNHHRPARRFLFFHFVISYLRAQSLEFSVKPNIAWPVPGRYVDKESLLMIGRCISGTELPELLYKGMVFEKTERPPDYADVALCLVIRNWVKRTAEVGRDGTECVLSSDAGGDGDLGAEGVSGISEDVKMDEEATQWAGEQEQEQTQEHEDQQQEVEEKGETGDQDEAATRQDPTLTPSKGRKKKKSKKATNN
ncbi:TFIIH complex subunit tfb5 [Ascosphaera pollenicola]|nr:TFIIH complex subunit tfb5 [Ascosphaera pollenicola]